MTENRVPFPEPDLETGALDAGGNLVLLPTLHQTLECAVLVRRAFHAVRPSAVVLELPRTIEEAFRRAVLRLPLLSVILYPDGDDTVYLLVEPHEPMVEAARLALENGVPLFLVDRDDGSYPLHRERAPDPYALTQVGPGAYLKALLDRYPASDDTADLMREKTMAYRLLKLAEAGRTVLWVGGVAHVRGILRALDGPLAEPLGRTAREGVRLAALAPDSSREVMSEIPFVAASFEKARSGGRAFAFDEATDSARVLDGLLKEAAARYEREQRQEVPRRAFEVLRQFSRSLCLLQGVLVPGFYELVVAARSAVDEDFAWHVFDIGATWPWQDASHSLPEVQLKGEDLFLDGKPVRFHRRFPNKGALLRRLPVRNQPKEKKPGDWRKARFGGGICSYPPEDIVIEGFGNRLRRRAVDLLSSETRRVVPMTTSLLDGVDMKETLRRLHEGRLFVFEERPFRGGVGSVVVIFDEDEAAYPWKTTWLGEHGQESDMAFFATPPGETLDGPGISRCQYGGFVMTAPPGRLADVFSDPDYRGAEGAKEILLLAALDYALEPRVVYAAKTPPRAALKRWAAQLGKRIVYLPLGALAPNTARRLRTFHVLANRAVRVYAKDFIG